MGLFDQVRQAIDDPSKQANMAQLGQLAATMQQLSQDNNADTGTMQQVVSVVGGYVKSALQAKRQSDGEAGAQALVERGSQSGMAALQDLFSPAQQQQVAQAASQKSGMDAGQIQQLLPVILPIAMQFLNSGSSKAAQPGQGNNNSILNSFLDGDGDGDVDMGDMLGMASKFMK